jgi:hypothetical protein
MHLISRRHALGTAAALLAGGLAACGGDGNATEQRTTLLVYLLGSDLESGGNAGTGNLREMLAAQGSTHTRVLITTGGANKREPGGLVSDWTRVKRFELTGGKLQELADLGPQNMDRGETLQDFLTWGVRTSPAERYMLVLWDHGAGYQGYGGDENHAEEKMSLPAMAAALKGFQSATGITLDYIGFDACLMATLEVARTIHPYARYLGASQELEPGSGWDWQAVIEAASRQPAPSLPEFGQVVASSFLGKQESEREEDSLVPPLNDYATFSIIDLTRVGALLERLDQWAKAVQAHYDDSLKSAPAGPSLFWPPSFKAALRSSPPKALHNSVNNSTAGDASIECWKQVAMARLRTTTFGYDPDAKYELDLMDLGQFASLLAADSIATGPQTALQQALREAVIVNTTGPRARHASGLSIYFPLRQRSDEQRSLYKALAMPSGYMALIDRHVQQAVNAPSAIHVTPLQVQGSALLAEVASVYGVQLADMLQVQPVQPGVVRITGNTPFASADIEEGYGRLQYDMQHWLQLGDQPLLLYTVSHHTDTEGALKATLYGAPVRLKSAQDSKTRIVLLLLNYRRNPKTYQFEGEIIGAQDMDFNTPDAPPDRVDRDIYPGDTVEPIHILYDLQKQAPVTGPQGEMSISFGTPVTLARNSALRPTPLAAGSHQLILSVVDLAGGVGLSEPLSLTLA